MKIRRFHAFGSDNISFCESLTLCLTHSIWQNPCCLPTAVNLEKSQLRSSTESTSWPLNVKIATSSSPIANQILQVAAFCCPGSRNENETRCYFTNNGSQGQRIEGKVITPQDCCRVHVENMLNSFQVQWSTCKKNDELGKILGEIWTANFVLLTRSQQTS